MSDFLGFFLLGLFTPPAVAVFYVLAPGLKRVVRKTVPEPFPTIWAASAGSFVVTGLIAGTPGGTAGGAVSLALALTIWWFNRRRRDKTRQLIGAKSRQLRNALVRRMRQLAPRPAVRPVPQGAAA